jgi:hypothetical protein
MKGSEPMLHAQPGIILGEDTERCPCAASDTWLTGMEQTGTGLSVLCSRDMASPNSSESKNCAGCGGYGAV